MTVAELFENWMNGNREDVGIALREADVVETACLVHLMHLEGYVAEAGLLIQYLEATS